MSRFYQWQIAPKSIIIEGVSASQGAYLAGGQTQKFVLYLQNLIRQER
jgi:hypothetical protein